MEVEACVEGPIKSIFIHVFSASYFRKGKFGFVSSLCHEAVCKNKSRFSLRKGKIGNSRAVEYSDSLKSLLRKKKRKRKMKRSTVIKNAVYEF